MTGRLVTLCIQDCPQFSRIVSRDKEYFEQTIVSFRVCVHTIRSIHIFICHHCGNEMSVANGGRSYTNTSLVPNAPC